MIIQYIIVSLIIITAIAYCIYRISVIVKNAGDPCHECSGCALHEEMLKKQKKDSKKPTCFNKK